MASTETFTINGFEIMMMFWVWDGDGIAISQENFKNLSNLDFIEALWIASELYPYYRDYSHASHHNEQYIPTLHKVSPANAELRDKFVEQLTQWSKAEWERELTRDRTPKPKRSKSGYVYLIRNEQNPHYKIGCSKSPEKRIESLDSKLPFPIEAIHMIKTGDKRRAEKQWHKRFADKRINGEWFALDEKDVAEFCAVEEML